MFIRSINALRSSITGYLEDHWKNIFSAQEEKVTTKYLFGSCRSFNRPKRYIFDEMLSKNFIIFSEISGGLIYPPFCIHTYIHTELELQKIMKHSCHLLKIC